MTDTFDEANKVMLERFQELLRAEKAADALYAVYAELLRIRASKKTLAVALRHWEQAKAVVQEAEAAWKEVKAAYNRALKEFIASMRADSSPETQAKIDAWLESHKDD